MEQDLENMMNHVAGAMQQDGLNWDVRELIPIVNVTKASGNFAVKGRVVSRSKLNKGRTGRLFSFHICDASAMIEVLAFGNVAVQLHDQIEIGQVYVIRNALVKPVLVKEHAYARTGHEFLLQHKCYNPATTYIHMPGDDSCPPVIDFTAIEDIEAAESIPEPGVEVEETVSLVNVRATVKYVSPIKNRVCKKTGQSLRVRDVTLANGSHEMRVTLWNKRADEFTSKPGDTIIVLDAKVRDTDYGTSLTGSQSFAIQRVRAEAPEQPELPDAEQV